MAGHSKWANIKHRKGVQDAKRSNLFSKLAKDIIIAAKNGADPGLNIRLKAAIDKARSANMPKGNIEHALKRGSGELEGVNYESFVYEGYGPGGVAVLVNVTTDNKNRAAADVRKMFSKFGGSLGEPNCVAWMFDMKGYMVFDSTLVSENDLIEVALEAGADDIISEDGVIEVFISLENYSKVSDSLERLGFVPSSSEITQIPQNKIALDQEKTRSFLRLVDALEELDDVSSVASNANLDAQVAQEFDS